MAFDDPKSSTKPKNAHRTIFEANLINLPDPKNAPGACQVMGSLQATGELVALAHIGRIATLSGIIDQLLDDTLWTMAHVDHERGACITSQMGSNYNRLVALEALARLHGVGQELINQLNKFSLRWKDLGEKRNRAVHDPVVWNASIQKMSVIRIVTRPQKPLKMELSDFDADEYYRTGNELAKFYGEFTIFRELLFAVLPTFD